MKYSIVGSRSVANWLTAGIFVLSLSVTALAQGGSSGGRPPGAGPPPNNNPRIGETARQANEARLRSAELEAKEEAESQKRIDAAIANMRQDFTRIQVLRNDIARDLVAHKPLDYRLINDQMAEINKRAQRLNVYMLARAPEKKEEDNTQDLKSEEMIGALVKLCKLIDSFTENPALKNAATIDAKQIEKAKEDKAKADADLLAIIKLSESIQKSSDSVKGP
ncbi:MAG TPA: hypothetical protein VIF64_15460 [Pyrinomonadaceae bacterium]